MSKLTLSVDPAVVQRAKRYAERRGTSVSALVEQYLDLVTRAGPTDDGEPTPLLRQVRSAVKGLSLDVAKYRGYLERKYR